MSPIGRVFVVLNLVLAGTFVGFAGTYLKNHTNWKDKHNTLQHESDGKLKEKDSSISELTAQLNKAERENKSIDSLNKAQKTELDDKRAETERMAKQMASLEADIKAIKADNSTVAAKITESTEEAKKTLALALAADEEKHKAMNAQKDAEAKLADANAKIANFETKVADLNGDVQKRQEMIDQQKVLISGYNLRYGTINPQPDVEGRVHLINEKLITIQITDQKGGELQKGNTLAIFNGSSYKGDMVVTSVEGTFAFGRVTVPMEGRTINVGDRVSTQLSK